ncbi:MAG: slipin family protein [Acidobacteriota bacterium]
MPPLSFPVVAVVVIFLGWLFSCINILNEYERGVIFRLGRVLPQPKGPGLIFVFKPFDRIVRVALRTIVLDVPPQDIITKDNVSVKVNAVVYFRAVDPLRAILQVENYIYATSQLSQTTLRSILGQASLDELLSEREKLSQELQEVIDQHTDPWGVKVTQVAIKQVDLPQDMQRAMALQAQAEREKRAKIINADGEFQASQTLANAAEIMAQNPITMQLRYLQTLTQISAENASTIVFPVPVEFLGGLLKGRDKA